MLLPIAVRATMIPITNPCGEQDANMSINDNLECRAKRAWDV